jgi:dolichol-phosphate mannosyltransferase
MFSLASAGIFGFSKKPLKLAISLGTLSIFIALAFAIWVFIMYLSGKESIVPGWSSTIITIVFLGGVQLFTIGILGEYIGNIFDETKNRPEYIIDKKINFDPHNNQTI